MTERGFEAAAGKAGWVVAYPEPYEGIWNDGRGVATFPAQRDGVDDAGFLIRLADRLARDNGVDKRAVFVAGYSAGGMMAMRLACERGDRVAGAASVSGPLAANIAERCTPKGPVPVLTVLGTQDPILQFDRGVVRLSFLDLGRILGPKALTRFWVKADGCRGKPKAKALDDVDPTDGSTVRRLRFSDCRGGSEVTRYEVRGGGHTWPGGRKVEPDMVVGTTNMDLDATRTIFDFFARHAPAKAPR